ncbi:MAG: hypothetical protein ACR2PG_01800 [Hyphomicrobiaceae bacterium]
MERLRRWIKDQPNFAGLFLLVAVLAGVIVSTYLFGVVAAYVEIPSVAPQYETTAVVIGGFILLAVLGLLIFPATWLLLAAASIIGCIVCLFVGLVGPGLGFLVLCVVCLCIGEIIARAQR